MHASSPLHRRLLLGAAVGLFAEPVRRSFAQSKSIKAIAFDGFVIIDPRPVAMRAEELFPAKARA